MDQTPSKRAVAFQRQDKNGSRILGVALYSYSHSTDPCCIILLSELSGFAVCHFFLANK